MNLPPLSIPDFSLPFAIPHMVHPLFVHFAIALPVVIILFELVNLATKRRSIGVMSFVLILLLVVAYAGAYLTGITDGQEAKKLLSPEAKQLLGAHKQLGIYLVYGSLVVLLFKLISSAVNKFPARLVFLLVLIGFTLTAFNEGKKGGELVYTYGANVKAVSHATTPAAPSAEAPVPAKAEAHTEAPVQKAGDAVKEATEKAVESTKEAASEAVEKTKEAAKTVQEKAEEAVTQTKESVQKAAETVKEKAAETTEKAKKAVEKAVKPAQEAPAKPVVPVETVPAG